MVTFIGTYNGWPATLTIDTGRWSPVEVGGKRWAVTDGERYVGSYTRYDLANGEAIRRNSKSRGDHVTFDRRTNKWMANIPGEGFYGRYDTKEEGLEAIAHRRNFAAERKLAERAVRPPQRLARGGNYRVMVERRHYGTYATEGHAVLLRDFVFHMLGRKKVYPDYLMPLAFVTNAIARSLIDTQVHPATPEEIETYNHMLDQINGPPPERQLTGTIHERMAALYEEDKQDNSEWFK